MTSYYSVVVRIALSCTIFVLFDVDINIFTLKTTLNSRAMNIPPFVTPHMSSSRHSTVTMALFCIVPGVLNVE